MDLAVFYERYYAYKSQIVCFKIIKLFLKLSEVKDIIFIILKVFDLDYTICSPIFVVYRFVFYTDTRIVPY